MINKSNKFAFIFSIALILGAFLVSPVQARTVTVDSGVNFNPTQNTPSQTSYPNYYPQNYPSNYNEYHQGCEGRNTGYNMNTGQPCFTYNQNANYYSDGYNKSYNMGNTVQNTNPTVNPAPTANTSNSGDPNDINESYGSLTANALTGSNSFMPTGVLQWILFIGIIVAIIFLWRYIHHSEEKYMHEPMKHA